ncbi:MAG: ABC transporter ATP-binding protein [Actinomycetota bacterium]|nr:ABC transporter ATP-binding protein [Actinomycetota bacterium]
MTSLLEVEDLRTEIRQRSRTVRAVDGVSFTVAPGETLGIVGESGCGKTMTGLSVMRLLPAGGRIANGAVRFAGRDLATADAATMRAIRGNEIGMVFQDPMTSLNPTMTIGRQIASPVRLHLGLSRAVARARAAEVLALVGMPRPAERLDEYPHQLSGGLRQRAMIAMALACEPRLLIADEPTTALDVTIQAQILDLLDRLKEELSMAVVLVTHDMGVIAGRADRVLVMYAGKVVESAPTATLFEEMRHPYTEALLASIPHLDQDKSQRLYSIPGLPPDLASDLAGCRFAARCGFAVDRCRAEEPQLAPAAGDDGSATHVAACHFPRDTSVEALAEAAAGGRDLRARGAVARTAGPLPVETIAARGPSPAPAVGPVAPIGAPSRAVTTAGGRSGPAAAPEVILSFEAVHKEFPVRGQGLLRRRARVTHAVSGVSLEVRRGETFGLVGESGCGKTTLGRLTVALEAPTAGRVVFDGQDLSTLSRSRLRVARRGAQLMFQDPYASLDPRMQIGEIVAEPLAVRGTESARDRRRAVSRLVDEVGLPMAALDRYPHEFSGGQRQRVGLARALALNPALIVADEPVSALDVSIRSQILNLMRRLQATHGLTYVVISHDLSVVRYLADHVGVMYLGKLVEVGAADEVYAHPAHPYTAALLDAIPVPDPRVERSKRSAGLGGELPSAIDPPSGCRFRTRCPRASERCAAEEPKLVEFGGDQRAACHHPLVAPIP